MPASNHRPTRILIDSQAIFENIQNEIQRARVGIEIFATVKANAYGHGMIGVAKIARKAGIAGFCVATIDEGIELRKAGFKETILILGITSPEFSNLLIRYNLSVVVATLEWLHEIKNQFYKGFLSKKIKVHLKIDTGMGRIGFRSIADVKEALEIIENSSMFAFSGLCSHFATADDKNDILWIRQNLRFQEIVNILLNKPHFLHTANTASAFWHKDFSGNLIRFGIGMYGLNPSGRTLPEDYPLKPALSLESELVQVKKIAAGESISYGQTWVANEPTWIGTVPIGYADGWLRKMQGFSILVAGEYCEIVGRICMDQLMIRLPKKMNFKEKVTLIGKNGEREITMQDVADHLGTIHYEVACLLGERIPRFFI
ncbi:MAG: alanine racemase [Lactobacillales bacterium]|jgi:alanine racemase|nr:alanine racemase [Lactobacillales bacterium]